MFSISERTNERENHEANAKRKGISCTILRAQEMTIRRKLFVINFTIIFISYRDPLVREVRAKQRRMKENFWETLRRLVDDFNEKVNVDDHIKHHLRTLIHWVNYLPVLHESEAVA